MVDYSEFVRTLRAEFPGLREDLDLWVEDENPHFEMAAFREFMEKAVVDNNWDLVTNCLRVLERIFKNADYSIKNAVYVSFLEQIDLSKPSRDRLTELMSPVLLHAHEQIDEYLIQLGTRKKSYRPVTS